MTDMIKTKSAPKCQRKMARDPRPERPAAQDAAMAIGTVPTAKANKTQTKTALVLGLLQRPTGASLDELVIATGWLPHTTRAALTGLKKRGHNLASDKVDGVRRYRVGGAAA